MGTIFQDTLELGDDPRAIGSEHVLQPVQRLDDAHRWTTSPVETARSGGLETNLLTPQ